MKNKFYQRAIYLLIAPFFTASFLPKEVLVAGEIYSDPSNCSTINCGATDVPVERLYYNDFDVIHNR